METPRFKTQFNYHSFPKQVVVCTMEERMTKSEFAAECDINRIMAKYRKTGVLPDTSRAALARYMDVSDVPTFDVMHQMVEQARDAFAELPPEVRQEFNNDPVQFMTAVDSEKGVEKLRKAGLLNPPSTPSPASPAPSAAGQAAPAPSVAPGVADANGKGGSKPTLQG